MSFRAGLRDHLLSQPAISSLVEQRIYPSRLPDKPGLPAVVYLMVSNVGGITHDGAVPLRNPRLQIDVWANRVAEAEAVQDAVADALVGYRGALGEDIEYSAGWRLENTTDLVEEETGLYRISSDFRGWYAPAAAGG